MNNQLLLPNKYKIYGWILLVPSLIIGIYSIIFGFPDELIRFKTFALVSGGGFSKQDYFTFDETDMTFTLFGIFFILGGLIVSFSKVKSEDEFTNEIRLNSLLWAVLINFLLLLISFLFIYGNHFFTVMSGNMFTIFIIFIARFHYQIYKISKIDINEK
jgi:hypothetical protein